MGQQYGAREIALAGSTGASALPTDLLEQASSRLGIVSLLYAVTYTAAFIPGYFMRAPAPGAPEYTPIIEISVAGISIGASLAIFLATRFVSVAPSKLLDFGLIYQVVASFGIAMAEVWNVSFDGHTSLMDAGEKPWFGISWVCLWILTFPVLVPNTPGKTLLSSFTSASMPPLALLFSLAFGATESVPTIAWAGMMVACYGAASIAFITARYIHGLGKDIREAREMGSYRLVERLGHGGMGDVWRAEHRMLARPAAIKLIRTESIEPHTGSSEIRRRFEREATATAMLRSPHTVELYDFGVTDDGRFYYVMELLDGVDLETFVHRFGAAGPARVVHWLIQACESLAEAHECGLVHRDIKPANIYICRLGTAVDVVKVLDFGLVKRSMAQVDASRLTADGLAAGTPGYMAPETAEGIGGIDHRADIYALGCVGYWLLTGKLVFDNDNAMKMIVDHVRTPPIAPSRRTELPVPADLDAIILACLEKDPARRPQTAAELAERLRSCTQDTEWTIAEARSWWQLHLPASGSPRVGAGGPPSAVPTE